MRGLAIAVGTIKPGHCRNPDTWVHLTHAGMPFSALRIERHDRARQSLNQFGSGIGRLTRGCQDAQRGTASHGGGHFDGSVGPLVERLAATGVTQLLSREPSLEELFLAQYGEPEAGNGEVASDVR